MIIFFRYLLDSEYHGKISFQCDEVIVITLTNIKYVINFILNENSIIQFINKKSNFLKISFFIRIWDIF